MHVRDTEPARRPAQAASARGVTGVCLRILVVLALALGSSSTLMAESREDESARVTEEEAARAYFTDLPLVTQEGREVRFFSDVLEGRVVLISSFYTACKGVSPRQGQVLSQLQGLNLSNNKIDRMPDQFPHALCGLAGGAGLKELNLRDNKVSSFVEVGKL